MDKQTYSISELADLAEVTPRTIRYYTAEGLLPPPETQGKYARYGAEHLERLQVIGRLKTSYLPLHEIRARLEGLDRAGIRSLLGEHTPTAQIAETSSAADYLAAVMARQQAPQADALHAAPVMQAAASNAAAAPAPVPVARPGLFQRFMAKPAEAIVPAYTPETWQRIVLAPGVELHLRQPTDATVRKQIQALIDQARSLFEHD